MVILLVAGSIITAGSYWSIASSLESYIVSVGILPKLCGQNIFEHAISNIASTFGSESCEVRTQRYNKIVNGIVGIISAAGWFNRDLFTRENIVKNYSNLHKNIKNTLFSSEGSLTILSKSPSQLSKSPSQLSKSPSPLSKSPSPLSKSPSPLSKSPSPLSKSPSLSTKRNKSRRNPYK